LGKLVVWFSIVIYSKLSNDILVFWLSSNYLQRFCVRLVACFKY
jgi:hypothetical protein